MIWASDPKAELQASDLKMGKEIEDIPGYMNGKPIGGASVCPGKTEHDWHFLALWPGRAVQPTSEEGAHCLSEASLRAAGVGEPRRAPEGPGHGQHGFGSFCRNKRTSPAGAKPGMTIYPVDNLV